MYEIISVERLPYYSDEGTHRVTVRHGPREWFHTIRMDGEGGFSIRDLPAFKTDITLRRAIEEFLNRQFEEKDTLAAKVKQLVDERRTSAALELVAEAYDRLAARLEKQEEPEEPPKVANPNEGWVTDCAPMPGRWVEVAGYSPQRVFIDEDGDHSTINFYWPDGGQIGWGRTWRYVDPPEGE